MRDELKQARLREQYRTLAIARRDATIDLLRHQDAIIELESRRLATQQDLQGLRAAQKAYDDVTAAVHAVQAEMAAEDAK